MSIFKPLYGSDLVRVLDHRCDLPAKGWSREHGGEPPHLLLLRRGAFVAKGLVEAFADPYSPLVYDGDHGYRTRRPADGGDDATKIEPCAEIADEVLRGLPPQLRITPAIHLKHLRVYALAKQGRDRLAIEEAAMALLHDVARLNDRRVEHANSDACSRRIGEARAFLAAAPEEDHRLADVAKVAGYSPFHFARLFREEVGCSLRAYRLRLRLAMAASRLADGAHDLSSLAMDTGFSHHSHMTAAFRTLWRETPSEVRHRLGLAA